MRAARTGRWDRGCTGLPRIRADQVSPRLALAIVRNSVSITKPSGGGAYFNDKIEVELSVLMTGWSVLIGEVCPDFTHLVSGFSTKGYLE